MDAQEIITLLELEPLPVEGGYFRRTYQSQGRIPAEQLPEHSGARFYGTAIFFLVTPESFSAFHVLPQDELFHFYLGDPVEQVQITEGGELSRITLGPDIARGHQLQALAPGRVWQATKLVSGGRWSLLGTTVCPGFEYDDYHHGHRAELCARFPQHQAVIEAHTRD